MSVKYGYNAKGQLETITYPSGKVVKYLYGTVAGSLDFARVSGIQVDGVNVITAIKYNSLGLITSYSYGNGIVSNRSYNTKGELTKVANLNGTASVLSYTYDHDPIGNVKLINNAPLTYFDGKRDSRGVDGSLLINALKTDLNNVSYEMDRTSNRKKKSSGTSTNGQNVTYEIGVGNRLNKVNVETITNGQTSSQSYVYAYNVSGNVTQDEKNSYLYERGNQRLITGVNGQKDYYDYNGLDERWYKKQTGSFRTYKKVNGAWNVATENLSFLQFVYNEDGQLLGEYSNTNRAVQETVYLGSLPLVTIQNNALHYIHSDHLGAGRVVTNGAKAVVWRWDSKDAFGASDAINDDVDKNGVKLWWNARLPGQYYDAESGNYYNYYRYYNPRTGRYLQRDPIGFAGGLNEFAYVGGNPTTFVDPWGLVWEYTPNPNAQVCSAKDFDWVFDDGPIEESCPECIFNPWLNGAFQVSQGEVPGFSRGGRDRFGARRDSSKNEKHGDGNALTKIEKQINELKQKLDGATKKEQEKIYKTIRNIKNTAHSNKRGEEHGRVGKR